MPISPKTGLLENARQQPSPNADERPDVDDISLVVIHSISLPPGEYECDHGQPWIERFFCNELPAHAHPYFAEICQMEVSAHLLIKRDGSVVQFVPFHRRAWHAGRSSYEGRENCNDYAIGIELEGTDDSAFEDSQYDSLASIILQLEADYPHIQRGRITGHSDIAPGRKTDPGTLFDWQKLDRLILEMSDTNAS